MRLSFVIALLIGTFAGQMRAAERLGSVDFATSCTAAVQAPLNRGIALLHDFWYEEAEKQFEEIAKAEPTCAMAHWGEALSNFHQIWNRPNEKTMAKAWAEMEKAQAAEAKTEREREYIAAAARFFKPGKEDYQVKIEAYSAAMAQLHAHYPNDVDGTAFYALSLLASSPPNDTSLTNENKALALLTPLFAQYPDHPGLIHYIIHACDTPSLAPQGLQAAERYGAVAASAPHAVHMPGHIFARLGMWQQDIDSNLGSVVASEAAEVNHQSGVVDQLHADDFLLYAYLQSGQEGNAKALVEKTAALLTRFEGMPHMSTHGMDGMFSAYRNEFPAIYYLEMRDWKSTASLEPAAGSTPQGQMVTYWARAVAAGHLHEANAAQADVAKSKTLADELRKNGQGFMADSTGAKIGRDEMQAWTAFAEGKQEEALKLMRQSADLQDKVGQGEVDIPAREMLADMLLEHHQPQDALVEYDAALKMSPNRFNGLFHAGMAAEAAGDKVRAAHYYEELMKVTENGSHSTRAEFAHVKEFMTPARSSN